MNNNTPLLYLGIYVDQKGSFLGGPFLVIFGDFQDRLGQCMFFFKSDFQTYLSQVRILVLDRKEPSGHFSDVLSW